ncbi:ABC transporter ATP-binding protein [Ichthyobacterium seriolicida]|uniref:Gliding motility protein GldA n=1 Tax=Ichthyobacterium seriolicida TaxID=242600 RepID=A0A1J1E9M7_9FLAO|nr:ATP-binding cassette domain-containing protein [Ichthyobacterium seriolicida]BAV94611.1 gliding motility protein GldA [Ichthyobacterium seriolicida]
MSIKVSDLSKYFNGRRILNGVSFDIPKGEIVGLLGPNGAGKSTLMKILNGYISACDGVAELAGFNVETDTEQVQNRIGYLSENNPLYTDMYIREYLCFVAAIYRVDDSKKRVEDIIDMLNLRTELDKKIYKLSKGYKQRIGLAQAMIHSPEVLILDEPTTGLDPNQLEDFRVLIKKFKGDKTILFSTHILQEVEYICDRIIFIDGGSIVGDIKMEDLKKNPHGDLKSIFSSLIKNVSS